MGQRGFIPAVVVTGAEAARPTMLAMRMVDTRMVGDEKAETNRRAAIVGSRYCNSYVWNALSRRTCVSGLKSYLGPSARSYTLPAERRLMVGRPAVVLPTIHASSIWY